jgi:hypothetical protein
MAALISALQRSGAPHVLQTLALSSPFFSESCSVVLSSGVITSPLHCTVTRTSAAGSLTYAAQCFAGPRRTGPRCLVAASRSACPHRQPHLSEHCSAVTNRGALADLHRWASSKILQQICKPLSGSPTNSQLHCQHRECGDRGRHIPFFVKGQSPCWARKEQPITFFPPRFTAPTLHRLQWTGKRKGSQTHAIAPTRHRRHTRPLLQTTALRTATGGAAS